MISWKWVKFTTATPNQWEVIYDYPLKWFIWYCNSTVYWNGFSSNMTCWPCSFFFFFFGHMLSTWHVTYSTVVFKIRLFKTYVYNLSMLNNFLVYNDMLNGQHAHVMTWPCHCQLLLPATPASSVPSARFRRPIPVAAWGSNLGVDLGYDSSLQYDVSWIIVWTKLLKVDIHMLGAISSCWGLRESISLDFWPNCCKNGHVQPWILCTRQSTSKLLTW